MRRGSGVEGQLPTAPRAASPLTDREAPAKQLTLRNLKGGFQGFAMKPGWTLAATNRVHRGCVHLCELGMPRCAYIYR